MTAIQAVDAFSESWGCFVCRAVIDKIAVITYSPTIRRGIPHMDQASENDYKLIIFAGSESLEREYKASFPWDRGTHGPSMAKVAKSIMAMSNLRDGGHIVFGIDDANGQCNPTGVSAEHFARYSHDNIADFVKTYAEPYVRIDVDKVNLPEGNFVIIRVYSFDESPVVCRQAYGDILSQGAIYVRSVAGRPQSVAVTNYIDMRRLMDLAVERGIRVFLERHARVQPIISQEVQSSANDNDLFEKQLKQFDEEFPLPEIRERGYWYVAIVPGQFKSDLLPSLSACEDVIEEIEVRNGGWYFPHFNRRDVKRGADYIEISTSWEYYRETWRYYRSGLFVGGFGLNEDWATEAERYKIELRPGAWLMVTGALYLISDVYEFASRLAQRNLLSDAFDLELNLENTMDRVIGEWPGSGAYFSIDYTCTVQRLPYKRRFEVTDFVSKTHEYSYEYFRWLADVFGYGHAANEVYKGKQNKFLSRGR